MCKYISLGKFNKNYFFVLGSISVRLLRNFINGFSQDITPPKKLYLFNRQSFFIPHPLFKEFLQYFTIGLIGFILEMIYYKKSKNVKSEEVTESSNVGDSVNDNDNDNDIIAISIDRIGEINDKKNFGKILLVIFFYFLSQFICDVLNSFGYVKIKFWPLEYLFLIFFSKKILHRILYKHQKVSLIILIVICTIIFVLGSFLPRTNNIKGDNVYEEIIKDSYWYMIPIIIILYLIAMAMNSFSVISFKWLIDIQYITITRILLYIGIIGFIFSFSSFFIFSNIPCNKVDIKLNLKKICKLQIKNSSDIYYENYTILGAVNKDANFYIDIFIVLILYLISGFFNIFFDFMIIKNLDPFYLIPIRSTYYIITEMIDYFITLGKLSEGNIVRLMKFVVKVFNNAISVILTLIYFEIIELHFCGLDRHLRRFIIKREDLDKKCFMLNNMSEDSDENYSH